MVNLYVVTEYTRGYMYGIGTYIDELLRVIKDDDIDICIVHLNANMDALSFEKKEGINHWYIPTLSDAK
jgi:hypothetical protein